MDRNLERDTVELLLETPELPPERREALARELEAVVARHLPGRPLRLLSGVDERVGAGCAWWCPWVLRGGLGRRPKATGPSGVRRPSTRPSRTRA
ncbi:hypothetical protein [Thermus amyloliquefaciens]|uniref:hypothetical protein n=1 Tax=Thermus amyloliquefaciens TaxID=1449080 RepID=UPI000AF293C2|nr:hypothetical protein [Thermus amyloliquefaciens]